MSIKSDLPDVSPQPQSIYYSAISSGLYATYVVGVSALMLILNSVLCLSAHSALTLFGPEWLTNNPAVQPQASQMFYFLAPVLLMVVEWNLLDRIQRLFSTEQN